MTSAALIISEQRNRYAHNFVDVAQATSKKMSKLVELTEKISMSLGERAQCRSKKDSENRIMPAKSYPIGHGRPPRFVRRPPVIERSIFKTRYASNLF